VRRAATSTAAALVLAAMAPVLVGADAPTTRPRTGQVVNGLQLRISTDRAASARADDLRLVLTLHNVGKTRKVVPATLCPRVRWPSIVTIHVQPPSGETVHLRACYIDLMYVHAHHPLAMRPGQRIEEALTLKRLLDCADVTTAVRVRRLFRKGGKVALWAEISAAGATWRSYYPDLRPPVEKPKAFEQGWPEWAWKGTVVSNRAVLTIAPRGGTGVPTTRPAVTQGVRGRVYRTDIQFNLRTGLSRARTRPLAVPVHIFRGTISPLRKPNRKHPKLVAVVRTGRDGRYKKDLAPGTYTVVAEVNGRLLQRPGGRGRWVSVEVRPGRWAGRDIQVAIRKTF